ncbi:MAG: hypothetical protein PHC75_05895 [Burkholderiales bacterium]|nr:hypothetical protein [Burkholderiales bacterium]
MRKLLTSILACSSVLGFACTSFGYITKSGTVIAKNRDYMYSKQTLEVLVPNRQFIAWYKNPYGHQNKIFALMANNDVKMAINENGLTAIEEDPLYPKDSDKYRRYIQPYGGYSEGMVLWGVAQNFNTVAEIKPYIKDIFSNAAPNYYEFADGKEILIVEVAYGENDNSSVRKFKYKIINKDSEYYTQTNYYKESEFSKLNNLGTNKYSLAGAIARNQSIESMVKNRNLDGGIDIMAWLLNTKSDLKNPGNANWCLNTSVFRSNLQGESSVDTSIRNDNIYGTVSSLIVFNNGSIDKTNVAINIIDKITVLSNGSQKVDYRMVRQNLPNLFSGNINYIESSFVRNAPVNGVCE